jgi:hypothetical protein
MKQSQLLDPWDQEAEGEKLSRQNKEDKNIG